MTFGLMAGATGLLVLFTLLPLLRYEAWWIRGHDFPRLQYALLALVLLGLQACLLDLTRPAVGLLLAFTVACLAYQAWWIWPYTRLHRKEVLDVAAEAKSSLRILGSNVLMTNRNAAPLLRLVRAEQPDVLIAVETDLWWQGQLDTLLGDYPHTMKCPLDNLYGMLVYSRLPLEDAATQFIVEPDIPSMHALLVLPSGDRIKLHCVHPRPPSPTENPVSTERDAELIAIAKSIDEAAADIPVIVAGDLNDVAWSSTTRLFRKISGLLDPRVGRGMVNTFHADYAFLRWPLDHLFHSDHFALVQLRRLESIGSDHFPILVELALAPRLQSAQEGLEADADDHARADEKAAAEGVGAADVHTPGGR
jgi:endonuclease/exonuclease/phosphatase (EEP) superfamily protein YafD